MRNTLRLATSIGRNTSIRVPTPLVAPVACVASIAAKPVTVAAVNGQRWFSGQPYHFINDPRKVAMIGMPMSHGQPLGGVERGPHAIRERGLIKKIENDGWLVEDFGNLSFPVIECSEEEKKNKVKYARMIGSANKLLAETTRREAQAGKFVLSLGGDHSIGIGSIAGILDARPDTALVWVDAHADINTPRTTLSGNIHGMSVAFLMGLENTKKIPGYEWMQQTRDLLAHRLVYIGLRDLDLGEKKLIRDMGIKAFTMQDVDRHGIGEVMNRAVDHIVGRSARPIHLSFDIDSVDPEFAPSTGTRVRGGLSYREAYFIAESLAETGMLGSMDMVEVNPALAKEADAQATVDMAIGLISSALGNRIL